MTEDDTLPHVEAMPPHIEWLDMTQFVRMSLRPPTRFAAGTDFKLIWDVRTAGTFKTQASLSETTPNAAMVVEGNLGDRCTQMLIDTGSVVSLVREDVWREAAEDSVDHLTHPAQDISEMYH